MEYRELGRSGIMVSQVALGTWGLGGGSVWSDRDSTEAEAARLLDACREYGINYIDTAPVYGTGRSEQLLGKALTGRRGDFILQTKCSLNWRREGGNFHYERDGYTVNNDTSAAAVKKDVEESLLRMKTNYIDSLIVHYVCPTWPVEETVGALEDLIREGKIRTYGLSNSKPSDLRAYQAAARAAGRAVRETDEAPAPAKDSRDGSGKTPAGVAVVQEFFSILSPFHGRDYFEACRDCGTSFQTYGVLEEGFLTGPGFLEKSFAKTDIRSRIPWVGEPYRSGLARAYEIWEPIRAAHGCSWAQLMLAWALSQFENMSLLVGMRRGESVADTAACTQVALSAEEIRIMEDAVRPIQIEVLDK